MEAHMKKRFVLCIFIALGVIFTVPDLSPLAQAQEHQHGPSPEMPKALPPKTPIKFPRVPPKESPAKEGTPAIQIPLEKQQLIGVRTAMVNLQPLIKVIRTVGRMEYDERKLTTVNTKIEGWIEKLYINYTGIYVHKGDVVAEIYSPELLATQQEFLNLLKLASPRKENAFSIMLAKDAQAIAEAAKERLRLWDITEEQIKKIEETGRPLRSLTVYSPVSGYVTQKQAVQGMRVMAGEKLLDVADLSIIWVMAEVFEEDLSLIHVGQQATVSLSYFPGREFSSKVDFIYPSLTGETRTARVRFTLPNPKGDLKPQMYTRVEFKVHLGKKLAIPEDAVLDTGLRQVVYVDRGKGYFEPRDVSLGLRAEGFVEVLKGLKAGERVAISANFLIDSEAKLKGIGPKHSH